MPSTTPAATDPPGARRRAVASAGHTGDAATVLAAVDDPDPRVRATALGALARLGRLDRPTLDAAAGDPDPVVRRRACELAVPFAAAAVDGLVAALADPDGRVVEAACFALGEIGAPASAAVPALSSVTAAAEDPLCREAAVAALGAIGSEDGLPAILGAVSDKPAVRRRAVLALAPFDGPEVDAALERAATDRDWQVRQAAEDLTGDAPAGP